MQAAAAATATATTAAAMSSSYVKSQLKASREAIQAKDWDAAIAAATQVLDEERDNYNAHVFKGLALLNAGRHEESETCYRRATQLMPKQALAWQGLERFYTETERWDKVADVVQQQMNLAVEADDAVRCAELQQRLVALRRQHGSQSQVAGALESYLGGSAFFDLLSSLPPPDQTNPEATSTYEAQMAIHVESLKVLLKIIAIREDVERSTLDREIEKRKTRLDTAGKSREQLRGDIGIEIWESSRLPELYEQVLGHTSAPDDVRRDAEHKLLLYRHRILKALPNPGAKMAGPSGMAAVGEDQAQRDEAAQQRKDEAMRTVHELAEGIVAIDVPDEFAWSLVHEWQDVFHVVELDFARLRSFIGHFPRAGLSASFRAILITVQDQQFVNEQKELAEKADFEVTSKDPLTLALDGLEQAPDSLLAHRVASALYLRDRDWLSCSEVATAGLTLLRRAEATFSIDLRLSRAGLEANLAMALTYLYAPQHHTRALRLCDAVLAHKADDIDTLMSKSHIYEMGRRWAQARATLVQVQQLDDAAEKDWRYEATKSFSVFVKPARGARLEVAWCDVHLDRLKQAEEEMRQLLTEMQDDSVTNGTDEAQAWWRLGQCLWRMGGSHRSDRSQAFTCFITALKKDAAYAPAFTSLGLFYNSIAEPCDQARASKCLQKAFELDARQNEAARQLAEIYAQEEDWDLVDLVARRTVEAEGGAWLLKGAESMAGRTRRHVTENAWAWSAIGSTELVRGNHERAITALQTALRSFPDKAHIWMRLGEAYVASQRLSAAIKTFERAKELQSQDEKWQAVYSIAIVQLQLGMYEEAILALNGMTQPASDNIEIGVVCAEARLSLARREAHEGFGHRAAQGVLRAIDDAQQVLARNTYISAAWKVIADSFLHLASMAADEGGDMIDDQCIRQLLDLASEHQVDEGLRSITVVTEDLVREALAGNGKPRLLLSAVYFFKLRTLVFADDEMVTGSAWMDLAVALDALYKREFQGSTPSRSNDAKACQAQAIACVKEALQLEPGNDVFWCSLGNLVFEHGVPLAQHCYIKAIECNSKSAIAWINLGFLYFVNNDGDLAHECFVRAQTLEPDSPLLWVGLAFVARSRGDEVAARTMFQNAYALGPLDILETAYGLASTSLHIASRPSSLSSSGPSQLRSASFALTDYLSRRPNDPAALHLSALLAERLGETDLAVERIDAASAIIEAEYEREESSDKAQLFSVCMVNLGRIHLAKGSYRRAQEVFDMSLGLLEGAQQHATGGSSEEGKPSSGLSADEFERVRLGAHCGIGLAQVAQGDWEGARISITQAQDETQELASTGTTTSLQQLTATRETLTVLLAQIQDASGDLQAAEDTLMAHVSEHPQSVRAMTLLGALSALKGDDEQLDVILSDLQEFTARAKASDDVDADQAQDFVCLAMARRGRLHEALERLERRSKTSLAALTNLVRFLLRAAVFDTGDGEGKHRYLQAAASHAASLVRSVKSRPAGTDRDAGLGEALRLQAVVAVVLSRCQEAAKLPAHEQAPDDTSIEAANGSAIPSFPSVGGIKSSQRLAIQALLSAPGYAENWQLLADATVLGGTSR